MTTRDPFQALARAEETPPLRVLEALRADMLEARPAPGPSRNRRLVASALWVFAGLLLGSLGAFSSQALWLLGGGAAFALVFGAGLLAGVVPGSRARVGLGLRRALLAALSLGLFSALVLSATEFAPWATAFAGAGGRHALSCGIHALLTGVLGAAGLLWIWRGTDPFTPDATGALFGAIAGLLGAFSVGLSCSSHEGWHLVVAHGSSVVWLGTACGWAGLKWLRP